LTSQQRKTSVLGKLKGVGEVVGYIVDLIVLWDFFTTKGVLSYLTTSVGAQAQTMYNIIVFVVLALAVCVPFYFGYKFQSYRSKKAHEGTETATPAVEATEKKVSSVLEPLNQRQLRYRAEVRDDLVRIGRELHDIKEPRPIQFESWNAFIHPDPRGPDINNKLQYDAIQNFSTVLNKRNDHLHGNVFLRLTHECVVEYEKIRATGFLSPDLPEELAQENMLQVYTRAEIERKFPFDSFISKVKRGGELVIVAGSFEKRRDSAPTIERLIREQNVTVTISLLAPFGRRTDEIDSDFKWQDVTVEIQQTLKVLCKLRKELKGLKDHLVIRIYDRIPTLSMIVIDPDTDDAIMQVGSYLSGADTSKRLVTIVPKKARRDVFDKYWAEYLLMRDDYSKAFNCKKFLGEFPPS
jgi:hypothetical protein